MELLFTYLDSMKILDKILFDFSLARGLDYYTGVIYEAVLTSIDAIGSISGGGRYDGLIGMFSGKEVPSVGGSIGIERIFNIMEKKRRGHVRATETQILVTSLGKGLTAKRMETLAVLWKELIKAETLPSTSKTQEHPKSRQEFQVRLRQQNPTLVTTPLILIIGEEEIRGNQRR